MNEALIVKQFNEQDDPRLLMKLPLQLHFSQNR